MSPKYKLIQSLSRAFSIIDCFTEANRELSLNQISQKLDLNINTTRGLVQTLLYYDYLSYDEENHKYRLGIIFIEKAEIAQFDYTEKVIRRVKNGLQDIADRFAVSARLLSISHLNTTTLFECTPSRSRYVLKIHDQTDFPLYASATGKLILSFMDEEPLESVISELRWEKYGKNTILTREELLENIQIVQSEGYAFEREELGDGYTSVALPICKDNEMKYSISITGTSEIISSHKDELVEDIKQLVEEIEKIVKD